MVIGSVATTLAAWINVLAAHPDRFYLVMIAQGLSALGQLFIMSVPPNLAAIWFGPDQVSSACAIGVFGCQVALKSTFSFITLITILIDELTGWVRTRFSYSSDGRDGSSGCNGYWQRFETDVL